MIGLFGGGFHPSLQVAGLGWGAVLSLGVWAGVWQARRTIRGEFVMVVDRVAGTMRLPMRKGEREARVVKLMDVQWVEVRTMEEDEDADSLKWEVCVRVVGKEEGERVTVEDKQSVAEHVKEVVEGEMRG